MAFYQILYWQDIPAQIKAWDDFDEAKVELTPRFMEQIDRTAQRQGLISAEDYLDQWRWGEQKERPGEPDEVAEAVRGELEATFSL